MQDRTKFIEEITYLMMKFGKADIRVGQVMELLRSRHPNKDLFNIENKQLMMMLIDLKEEMKI